MLYVFVFVVADDESKDVQKEDSTATASSPTQKGIKFANKEIQVNVKSPLVALDEGRGENSKTGKVGFQLDSNVAKSAGIP